MEQFQKIYYISYFKYFKAHNILALPIALETFCTPSDSSLRSVIFQDMYTSLAGAGFSHSQIEQTMTNTVLHGGDLIDALDWLCLNLANSNSFLYVNNYVHTNDHK